MVPERPLQRWSLATISDQLVDNRRFRVLNIVDDPSRFCPGQIVDLSISRARVASAIVARSNGASTTSSLPEEIVLDNGPEGTGNAMFDRSERTGMRPRFIAPGKPVRDTPSSRASTANSATNA